MTLRYRLDVLRERPDYLHVEEPRTGNLLQSHVSLDADGTVSVEPGSAMDGTPMEVWHGARLRWPVPGDVYGPELADWLESKPQRSLLERIHAGHTVEWDNGRLVGALDEDAEEASFRLLEAIERHRFETRVISARRWLFAHDRLDEIWDGGTPLDEVVASLEAEARDLLALGECYVAGSIREALLDEAEMVWERDSDELGPAHLEALRADGRIPEEDAPGCGA